MLEFEYMLLHPGLPLLREATRCAGHKQIVLACAVCKTDQSNDMSSLARQEFDHNVAVNRQADVISCRQAKDSRCKAFRVER